MIVRIVSRAHVSMVQKEGDSNNHGNIPVQLEKYYTSFPNYAHRALGNTAIQPSDPHNGEAISKLEYLSGADWVLVDNVAEFVRGIPQIPAMYCGQQFLAQRLDLTSTILRQDNPEEIFIAVNTQGQPVYSIQLVQPFIERLTQRAAIVHQTAQE